MPDLQCCGKEMYQFSRAIADQKRSRRTLPKRRQRLPQIPTGRIRIVREPLFRATDRPHCSSRGTQGIDARTEIQKAMQPSPQFTGRRIHITAVGGPRHDTHNESRAKNSPNPEVTIMIREARLMCSGVRSVMPSPINAAS